MLSGALLLLAGSPMANRSWVRGQTKRSSQDRVYGLRPRVHTGLIAAGRINRARNKHTADSYAAGHCMLVTGCDAYVIDGIQNDLLTSGNSFWLKP